MTDRAARLEGVGATLLRMIKAGSGVQAPSKPEPEGPSSGPQAAPGSTDATRWASWAGWLEAQLERTVDGRKALEANRWRRP